MKAICLSPTSLAFKTPTSVPRSAIHPKYIQSFVEAIQQIYKIEKTWFNI